MQQFHVCEQKEFYTCRIQALKHTFQDLKSQIQHL